MKKFEFTTESIEVDGIKLHRIKALVDLGDVKAGELGGYVEREDNLSQSGNAWVCEDARVCGNALVCGNARVFGNALVCGNAWVCDDALVCGNAWVCDDARVCDDALVCGNAIVCGNALVCDDADYI
jgi:carbonic anhydrase/acetyltransferase-like protein (isoleucine patch superfamily)